MRETHRGNTYKPGDYWRECGVCGFDYLRSEMVFRWDGLLVCQADNDERNPQETPSYNHNHPPFSADGQGKTAIPSTDNYFEIEGDLLENIQSELGPYLRTE